MHIANLHCVLGAVGYVLITSNKLNGLNNATMHIAHLPQEVPAVSVSTVKFSLKIAVVGLGRILKSQYIYYIKSL